jgi:TetR/AcrR family transcriptional regulator
MARPQKVSPERILDAAAVEFALRGYSGARVDGIARRARVNKAMLYYHFGSKQTIYRALLRSVFTNVAERLRAIGSSGASPVQMLDRAVAELAEFTSEHPHFPSIMLREVAGGGTHLDRDTLAALTSVPKAFGSIVMQGVQSGAFRPVNPIAAYFSLIAPIVFYMAAAPIRKELAEARLLDIAALSQDSFVAHVQDTMRRAFSAGTARRRSAQP